MVWIIDVRSIEIRISIRDITYQRFVASVLAAMSTKGDHEVLPTQREAPVWRASGDAGGRRGDTWEQPGARQG